MSRLPPPQFSFADLELRHQAVHLDPLLQGILAFLDDHAALVDHVRQDLVRGLKNPHTGRDGITASQTLRSLILMRIKNWDYRELRERINDGFTLRTFTDFDSQCVPKHDAFNRAFNRLTPATIQAINQAVVRYAVQLGLEDGQQLRVDTTVVETDTTFITLPTPPYCGTRCAPLRDWSRICMRSCPAGCRASPTAPAALAAECKPSSG
jgi:IS5 family transposase